METERQLNAVFFALADQRRRALLAELAAGPRTVSQLALTNGRKLSATSKDLATLEAADLILKRRQGRVVYCHMNYDVWRVVAAYIAMHARFWAGRLDELESYLKDTGVR